MTDLLVSPAVSLVNGRPSVSSLKIAEHFGKRHDSVLRDIRRVTSECPDDFNAHNFVAVEYADEKGESRPAFNVFQDGFVLLVMGYTGKQALQIKLVYIAAFNAMRAELEKKPAPKPRKKLPVLPLRSLPRVEQTALPSAPSSDHAAALAIKALNPAPGLSGEYYEAELLRVFRDFAAWRTGVLARMEELEQDYSRVTGLLHRDVLRRLMEGTPFYMTDMGVWAMGESYQDAVRAVREGVHKWECLFSKAQWFAKILRVNW